MTTDPIKALADAARRCAVVLRNMALEKPGSHLFGRWEISDEPLRNDAMHIAPVVEAALAAYDAAQNMQARQVRTTEAFGNEQHEDGKAVTEIREFRCWHGDEKDGCDMFLPAWQDATGAAREYAKELAREGRIDMDLRETEPLIVYVRKVGSAAVVEFEVFVSVRYEATARKKP